MKKESVLLLKLFVVSPVVIGAFGLAYESIDIMGTINQYWVGNPISVAVAAAVTATCQSVGAWLLEGATSALEWFGLSHNTAEMSAAISGAILYICTILVVAFYALPHGFRIAKESACEICAKFHFSSHRE